MIRTVRPAGAVPSRASVFLSNRTAPSPNPRVSFDACSGHFTGTSEPTHQVDDGVQGAHHVRLRATEGRESQGCELRLQRPNIVPAQRQVMHKIPRACPVPRMHVFVGDQSRSFQFQHLGSQKIQVLNEFVQLGVIYVLHIRLVCGKTLLRLKSKRRFHEKRFCPSLRHSRYRLVNGKLNTSHAVPYEQAGEISSHPLQTTGPACPDGKQHTTRPCFFDMRYTSRPGVTPVTACNVRNR